MHDPGKANMNKKPRLVWRFMFLHLHNATLSRGIGYNNLPKKRNARTADTMI